MVDPTGPPPRPAMSTAAPIRPTEPERSPLVARAALRLGRHARRLGGQDLPLLRARLRRVRDRLRTGDVRADLLARLVSDLRGDRLAARGLGRGRSRGGWSCTRPSRARCFPAPARLSSRRPARALSGTRLERASRSAFGASWARSAWSATSPPWSAEARRRAASRIPSRSLAALERLGVGPRKRPTWATARRTCRWRRSAGVFAVGVPGGFPNREALGGRAAGPSRPSLESAVSALAAIAWSP